MTIIERPIESIQEYKGNPRDNDGAVDSVAESIKLFGFKIPIIIDSEGVIVCGHTRIKAARKIGLKSVPCIIADDLTPDQLKAFRLADNKTAELADWDIEKLLAELKDIDVNMEPFGFSEEEIQGLADKVFDIKDDDAPEVDMEAEPITKPGDLYIIGDHRLLCGDSTDITSLELLVEGKPVDLLITDPPYNVNYEGGTDDKLKIMNDHFSTSTDFRAFLNAAFNAANSVMKPGAAFYIWHSDSERMNFQGACEDIGWKIRENLIWVKNSFVMGRQDYQWKHEPCLYGWKEGAAHYFIDMRNLSTLLEFNRPQRNEIHPTMKPIELFAEEIRNSSRPGEIVLDLFGGSGTTIIASEQLGRKARVCELDPRYCDAIVKRWEEFTGQKAERITNK